MNFEQAGLGCLALKNFIHVNLCDVKYTPNILWKWQAIIYQKKNHEYQLQKINKALNSVNRTFTISWIYSCGNSIFSNPSLYLDVWRMKWFSSFYFWVEYTLDILFSSNHNIHKSWCGLCFFCFRHFNWRTLVKSII